MTNPTNTNTTSMAPPSHHHLARRVSLSDIQFLEVLVAFVVFVVIYALRQKRRHGLPVWPFFGMMPSLFVALRGDMYEWISDILLRQNGTFMFLGPRLSNINCVVTADPRNLEHLLKTRFLDYPKGENFRTNMRDLLGDGIFNADDEAWQQQRKTASLELHSTRFRQLTVDSLLELVHHRLLPVLEDTIERAIVVDLQDVLLRLTFDNACMIAFGADPGCLQLGLPEIPFAQAFEDATEATVLRFVTPTFLLTVFMKMKDEEGRPFSDKFLRDICVNFILAGRDTSSVALSWFFWLLDKNPAAEERILEEICEIVKDRQGENKDQLTDGGATEVVFKADEVKKMEHLQAALSEALRLYPSVPVDHKEVLEDDIFPDGMVLKKGTKVIYAIYSMGRMEAIWGKDCREYKPERWLKDGHFMSESAYKFTAFNAGPRLCLGKDFAYYQMKFAAAAIIYRYHVKVVIDHPVTPKLALTMYMKYGLKVNLLRRDRSELQKYLSNKH